MRSGDRRSGDRKTVSSSTPSGGNSDNTDGSFLVKIKAADLTIRSGAGTNYKAVGHIKDKGTYTITQVQYNGPTPWGKLKSKAGWISLHSALRDPAVRYKKKP